MAKKPTPPRAKRYEVLICPFNDLRKHLDENWIKANQKIFGRFKSDGEYLIVKHMGNVIRAQPLAYSDQVHELEQAYLLGYWDGHGEHLSKHDEVENEPVPVAGLVCEHCGAHLFDTAHGRVCDNGHGGVEGIPPVTTSQRIRV